MGSTATTLQKQAVGATGRGECDNVASGGFPPWSADDWSPLITATAETSSTRHSPTAIRARAMTGAGWSPGFYS
jgi:hypothetical protein